MNTTLSVRDKNITVVFRKHAIKLHGDEQLMALLATDTEAATEELTALIKSGFQQLYNREINISNASMAVEIWGHVYAEKFIEVVKSISPLHFIDNIADKLINRCEIIDMGERGNDSNRFVWDALAVFKSAIAKLLPKAAAESNGESK